MNTLLYAVLLTIVVVTSGVSGVFAMSDEDTIAKIQKSIDRLLDRIQGLEDKNTKAYKFIDYVQNNIDKRDQKIDRLQDKIAKKQAKIDMINGVEIIEPFITTDKLEYEIGETIHITGLDKDYPEQVNSNPIRYQTFDVILTSSGTVWSCSSSGYDENICEISDDGTYAIDIPLTEVDYTPGSHYIQQTSFVSYGGGNNDNFFIVSQLFLVN